MDKIFYMQKALEEAKAAALEDETPIGAIIVDAKSGEIIASAHNLTEHQAEATAHAEILAMQKAAQKLKQKRLWDMDLYVTIEPCTMCAAAISFMRINCVYFGAEDEKGGAIVNGVKFFEAKTCHHRPKFEGGILAQEAADLLKNFFKNKRK